MASPTGTLVQISQFHGSAGPHRYCGSVSSLALLRLQSKDQMPMPDRRGQNEDDMSAFYNLPGCAHCIGKFYCLQL